MIRYAWNMPNGCEGHGRSFHQCRRLEMQRLVEDQNHRYGEGTHWIEECTECVAGWTTPPPGADTCK